MQQPHNNNNAIFPDEDLQLIAKADRRLYTVPLMIMGFVTATFLVVKHGNLARLLPNPLKTAKQQTRLGSELSKKNPFFYAHILGYVGFASFMGAYFGNKIAEYKLYVKYRREVTYYLRWKIEKEIQAPGMSAL